jgi:3-(3-hydroxy-phenyl)propionate hydroxylase
MQGESNPTPWLVIDTREKEYDGKARYRFFCDPARPGMFIQTPHANRRWEWMLLPGEDREAFLQDENIHKLIAPFVDIEDVDIYRRRVYDFHAILADRFQQGRVFLAGDAAHMTPPFAGQGLNSGFRDATNLGWKLAAVVEHGAPLPLLESYEAERRGHALELIQVAVQLGNDIQPIDPAKAAERDAGFEMLQQSPEAMTEFQDGIFKPLADRYFSEGAAVDIGKENLSGRMLLQPELATGSGRRRLDEYLGTGFSIVGYGCDPAEAIDAAVLEPWLKAGATLLHVSSGEEGLKDDSGYFSETLGEGAENMVLVRPDRFCMAVFNAASAAERLSRAGAMLGLTENER